MYRFFPCSASQLFSLEITVTTQTLSEWVGGQVPFEINTLRRPWAKCQQRKKKNCFVFLVRWLKTNHKGMTYEQNEFAVFVGLEGSMTRLFQIVQFVISNKFLLPRKKVSKTAAIIWKWSRQCQNKHEYVPFRGVAVIIWLLRIRESST